jgi:glycogen debranching enzyme
MCEILKEDSGIINSYKLKAEMLKQSILKYFYNADKNTFNYLIDKDGVVDKSQEALGWSFAVVFGIIEGEQANLVIKNAVVSKYGITSIYPSFPRFSKYNPGRHNDLIWPMVNGFFANAAVSTGNHSSFSHELNSLTHLVLDEDKGNYNFWEIFNPNSGRPDGGYQMAGKDKPNHHWQSCRYQTWSATAYLNMIYHGLFGFRFSNDGISFSPFLPDNIHLLEIKDLAYRQAMLNIKISGSGKQIKSFLLNGVKQSKHSLNSNIKGVNTIVIELNE